MPDIFGYIRVSTDHQSEEGVSLETQINKITDYCRFNNHTLIKIYSDAGISGATLERPGLLEMLDKLEPGMCVLITELSRLSRSIYDSLGLMKLLKDKECSLICLSPNMDFSTPFGQAMFGILMIFYQLERDQISERVKINMKTLSEQNLLRSKPPFGMKFNGKDHPFVVDEAQQAVIKIVIDLHKTGISYTKIAKYLNDNGHNKCLGRPGQIFYAQTVKNILSDQGIIADPKRKPLSERFTDTRRKPSAKQTEAQQTEVKPSSKQPEIK